MPHKIRKKVSISCLHIHAYTISMYLSIYLSILLQDTYSIHTYKATDMHVYMYSRACGIYICPYIKNATHTYMYIYTDIDIGIDSFTHLYIYSMI